MNDFASDIAKPTAKDIIKEAGIYELIGIDLEKCSMPVIDREGNMGRGAMVTDERSIGHSVAFYLEPALDDLVRGLILQKKAPFIDAEVEGSKGRVMTQLADILNRCNLASDKESATKFAEQLRVPFDELNERFEDIANQIVRALSEKIGEMDVATLRHR